MITFNLYGDSRVFNFAAYARPPLAARLLDVARIILMVDYTESSFLNFLLVNQHYLIFLVSTVFSLPESYLPDSLG